VKNVKEVLGPAIIKGNFNVGTDLEKIDDLMKSLDGTKEKRKLGANAVLGISMACARAGAAEKVGGFLILFPLLTISYLQAHGG